MSDIVYKVKNALYLNITNRCTNQCAFCIRNKSKIFNQQYPLWLEKEPSADELLQAIGDAAKYQEIVFCGYGEPLIRLELVKQLASQLKQTAPAVPLRINTNGQANLFWDRNILPELEGLIDQLSISLDTDNAESYEKLCRPTFGAKSFSAVIEFARQAKQYIPKVELSIVDLPAVDTAKAKQIAEELGVGFRVRPYYEEAYVG
jgi:TatD family-associated radical SAM protein